MRYYVNGHKCTMPLYLFGMMVYFNNFSTGAWMYFCLHGSYGMFWLLKDMCFPDSHFAGMCTVASWLMPFPIALIPYSLPGYWMMSGQAPQDPSMERIVIAFLLYMFGVMFMIVTDAQKYFQLRERRGLINDSMFAWSRNMNYFGEMMLYGSFAVICQLWEVWYILWYMWSCVFMLRMMSKDYSNSKKAGWPAYYENTWFLVPKIMNSTFISLVIYGVMLAVGYTCWINGGIEKTVHAIRQGH